MFKRFNARRLDAEYRDLCLAAYYLPRDERMRSAALTLSQVSMDDNVGLLGAVQEHLAQVVDEYKTSPEVLQRALEYLEPDLRSQSPENIRWE